MAELVYATDSKPVPARVEGSTPSSGTTYMKKLLVLVLLVLVLPLGADAKTAPTETPLEKATVNVFCRMKVGGATFQTTGTGSFVDSRGIIITNAHVAQYFLLASSTNAKSKNRCSIRTGSPAKEAYHAELLYMPLSWTEQYQGKVSTKTEGKGSGASDFALLYITDAKLGTVFPALPLNTVTTPNMPVSIAGYPADKLDFDGVKSKLKRIVASSTVTEIRSFTKPNQDILLVAPSKAGHKGVSGGPVVDTSGALVGIATTIGGDKNKDLVSLRALTTNNIDRTIRAETGFSLSSILTGDVQTRAALTELALPKDMRKTLETVLRRLRS